MKKILLFILTSIFILSSSFISCSDDDSEPFDNTKTIEITSVYKMENSSYEYPDRESSVYLMEFLVSPDYEYRGYGRFIEKSTSQWFEAIDSVKTNSEGKATIIFNYQPSNDFDRTIVVESSYYEDRFIISDISKSLANYQVKAIFNP